MPGSRILPDFIRKGRLQDGTEREAPDSLTGMDAYNAESERQGPCMITVQRYLPEYPVNTEHLVYKAWYAFVWIGSPTMKEAAINAQADNFEVRVMARVGALDRH